MAVFAQPSSGKAGKPGILMVANDGFPTVAGGIEADGFGLSKQIIPPKA